MATITLTRVPSGAYGARDRYIIGAPSGEDAKSAYFTAEYLLPDGYAPAPRTAQYPVIAPGGVGCRIVATRWSPVLVPVAGDCQVALDRAPRRGKPTFFQKIFGLAC